MDEKATQLHAIASLKVLLDATKPQNGAATTTSAHYASTAAKETSLQLQQGTTGSNQELPNGGISSGLDTGLESVNY